MSTVEDDTKYFQRVEVWPVVSMKIEQKGIDYARWSPPALLAHDTEPSVLTPKEREVFWCFASGMSRKKAYAELGICKNAFYGRERNIRKKIPGITTDACYGALAAQIVAYESAHDSIEMKPWHSAVANEVSHEQGS